MCLTYSKLPTTAVLMAITLIPQSTWFHNVVIDLFRPFADQQPQPKITAFAFAPATPAAVIAASIQQLKRLIYQYRSNFESSKYSIIYQSGMIYLANHVLRDLSSNEAQFYFLLCMRDYQHLARHIPFISGVVQSLFAIAVRQGTILSEEARRLFDEVHSENDRSHQFFSTYPVDLEITSVDPTASTLEKLVDDFRGFYTPGSSDHGEGAAVPSIWKGPAASMSATLTSYESDAV